MAQMELLYQISRQRLRAGRVSLETLKLFKNWEKWLLSLCAPHTHKRLGWLIVAMAISFALSHYYNVSYPKNRTDKSEFMLVAAIAPAYVPWPWRRKKNLLKCRVAFDAHCALQPGSNKIRLNSGRHLDVVVCNYSPSFLENTSIYFRCLEAGRGKSTIVNVANYRITISREFFSVGLLFLGQIYNNNRTHVEHTADVCDACQCGFGYRGEHATAERKMQPKYWNLRFHHSYDAAIALPHANNNG